MSWTDPRTWVTDEIVTSSLLNTHVRDNLKSIWHPYDYSPTDVDAANTTAETSLWSKTITGNDMGANGVLALDIAGDALRNNSAFDTLTIRVKFGGSTVVGITDNFNQQGTSGVRIPWRWQIRVENRGSASSQFVFTTLFSWNWNISLPAVLGGGIGALGTNGERIGMLSNTSSVDTTSNQTLQVTVQWSAASANDSWRKRSATLLLGQN